MEAAKSRNLEELDISYLLGIPLAPTIFCCKTLVVLNLTGISVATMLHCSVDLPLLEFLSLSEVRFKGMEDLMKLLSGCPKLLDLRTRHVTATTGITTGGYFKPLSKLFYADICLFEVPVRAVSNVEHLVLRKLWWWNLNLPNSKDKEDWKYPDHVPECVSSHLKICKINDYHAVEADFRRCIEDYAQVLMKCFFKQNLNSTNRLVRWNALDRTNMILNVDGSSIGNPGISGFGGLIRNSHGAWVRGFAGNIGFSNILHVELLAMYHGLNLVWELDIKYMICYSDSKTAINLIEKPINE
ncbi:uncharacterized protein LOC123904450 [Trifolium pratense]|uniref:uncharacterized protein LOC123904450 n=1 Tax=Trifolium pratense TaxID=57577 RepID=UPI001E691836|nr:uncharacterized protein LOC123904450 [Trifolium pratense]